MRHEETHATCCLERVYLALPTRFANASDHNEPIATSQNLLDEVRRPSEGDAVFMAGLLRLRGGVGAGEGGGGVGGGGRARAGAGVPPDGWFLVDLFKTMTRDLPRFRNIDLRRGPPWDALLHVAHP